MHVLSTIFLFSSFCTSLILSAPGAFLPRIVGGKDAPDGKYPYMVSLRNPEGHHFCGGSIINKRYILTATHCLLGDKRSDVLIHAGTNLINENGTVFEAEELTLHKEYNGYDISNDIALIRLAKDIEFTDKIQPITLATSQTSYQQGHPAIVTGWGLLSVSLPKAIKLQEITLAIESQEKCKGFFWMVKDSNICTYAKEGKGVCSSDSGGPLVADGVQIGIVSFGKPCATGQPDVYTRVSYYKNWIHENMRDV